MNVATSKNMRLRKMRPVNRRSIRRQKRKIVDMIHRHSGDRKMAAMVMETQEVLNA